MKNRIRRIFRKPSFISIFCGLLFIIFLFVFLKFQIQSNLERDIKNYIISWNYEITESLYKKNNKEQVEKIAQVLELYNVNSYEITIYDKRVLSWSKLDPRFFKKSSLTLDCQPIQTILTLEGGLMIGRFNACLSQSRLYSITVFSPIFLVCSLVVFLIIIFTSFLPLRGYQRALNESFKFLKGKSKDHQNKLPIDINDDNLKAYMISHRQETQAIKKLTHAKEDLSYKSTLLEVIYQLGHDIMGPIASAMRTLRLNKNMSHREKFELLEDVLNKVYEISQDSMNIHRKNNEQVKSRIVKSQIFHIIGQSVKSHKKSYPEINFSLSGPKTLNAVCVLNEFERIIFNLISNAIEAFTEFNSKNKIDILCTETLQVVTIKIMDNARGIPQKNMDHIFDEGFSTKNECKKGNGIGLYHARKKIKSWGGSINVNSKIGVGTTFTIKLIANLEVLELKQKLNEKNQPHSEDLIEVYV